jgi:hypothetical protein
LLRVEREVAGTPCRCFVGRPGAPGSDPVSPSDRSLDFFRPGTIPSAAAIANAIHHATGIRVRDLPITLDKLLRTA